MLLCYYALARRGANLLSWTAKRGNSNGIASRFQQSPFLTVGAFFIAHSPAPVIRLRAFLCQMADKKQIDWERIELEYRAGLLSVREIAASHGITHGAINKRSKRDGWEHDLTARIRAKADAVIIPRDVDEFKREGFIYVIYIDDSSGDRFCKIGMAKAFTPRFMAHQCASPFEIGVACAFFVANMRAEEKYLHQKFSSKRVRGEWFKLSHDDIVEISKRSVLA